tara:strand:+ start:5405 stop:7549 length:2145 start_codon:yes stop_codon:yes gene_type:complete
MARSGVNIRVGFDLKEFSKSSQNLSRSFKKTAKQMKSVGKSMSTALTLPIVALGGASLKVFADFEQSMAKVQAVSGATGAEFKTLNTLAKDLGISTRFTATQVSDLMLNYSKLGFSSSEIEKITESTLQLALATGEDLATSAEVAGSTLRGFGLEANEMQRVVDVMAQSFSSSALNLEKFSTSMATLAPVAKNANVSLEDATGYLSILVDRGVDATTAGTGLRNIFLDLAGSGQSLSSAMEEIRTSTNKNKTAFDLFGKRGATVASIMADNAAEAKGLSAEYVNSAGAAKHMAGIMDNTLEGSMLKVKSAVEGLGISFGEVLAPHLRRVGEVIANVAMWFADLSPATKKVIVVVAGLVAAIGPLIFAIGALTTAFAFLAANPIVLIITAVILVIAALAAGVYYLYSNWEALTERFSDIGWWTNALIDMGQFLLKYNPFSLLMELLDSMLAKIGITLNANRATNIAIAGLDKLRVKTKEHKTEIKSLGETYKELKDQILPSLEAAEVATGKAIKGISKAIGGLSTIKHNITFPIDVKLDLTSIPQQIEMLDLGVSKFGEKIEDFKQGVKGLLTNFAVDVGMFLAEALGDAMSGGFEGKDFGKAALSMLGGFMKQMGALMITYAAEMALFSASIANPLLWPVALAAGIAMVAAGAAISNLGSEGMGSTSSAGGGSTAPAPSYSNNGYSENYSNSMDIRISGRDLILVQERERAFRR